MLPDNVTAGRNEDRRLKKLSQNRNLATGKFIATRQLLDQGADQDSLLAIGCDVVMLGGRARSAAASRRQDLGPFPSLAVAMPLASAETLKRSSPSSKTFASWKVRLAPRRRFTIVIADCASSATMDSVRSTPVPRALKQMV